MKAGARELALGRLALPIPSGPYLLESQGAALPFLSSRERRGGLGPRFRVRTGAKRSPERRDPEPEAPGEAGREQPKASGHRFHSGAGARPFPAEGLE
jgi:hypothetical protein